MEEKNLILTRLLEFIESKGGFSEVARKIDKHSQMFHNLIRRNANPSLGTLEEIAANYPDFDLNYVVRGKRTIEFETWNAMKEENEQLKRERSIFLGAMEKLGKDKDATFTPKFSLFRKNNPLRRLFLMQKGLELGRIPRLRSAKG